MKGDCKFYNIIAGVLIGAILIIMAVGFIITATSQKYRRAEVGDKCFIETDKTWDYPLYELHEMRDCRE